MRGWNTGLLHWKRTAPDDERHRDMKIEILVLVLLAPLPFWMLGLPWISASDARRFRLVPLVGCALAGCYAELALIAGLPVRVTVGTLTLASFALGLWRVYAFRTQLFRAAIEWLPMYLVAVLAASVSPFPVLGNWNGDWTICYQTGQAVVGGDLPVAMLGRPPLFGSATAPLWIFSSGLIPYQLMAAVASAAAVTATLSFIEEFWQDAPSYVLLPLLASPFFLHHTAAAWSKLLAAALVLSAIQESLRHQRMASGALFALAVGVHEGSMIWAPCVLLAHGVGTARWRGVARAVGPMLLMGLVVVGPLTVWILVKYGLAAKVAANPVVAEPRRGSFLIKTLLAIVSTFVGWGPALSLLRWLKNPHAASAAVVAKEGYWLFTSSISTLAGTVVGLLFPFLIVRDTRTLPSRPHRLFNPWILAGTLIAVIANALITPFHSNEGTMQVGLVPLGLGLYAVFAGQLVLVGDRGRALSKRVLWIAGLAGTLPWLILNGGTAAGLWLSSGFRERIRTGSEGDYQTVLKYHLDPLGLTAFPQVPLFCLVLLIAWMMVRQNGAALRARTVGAPE
jgi:hypothetical protein